jgi:hypothetical protein
VCVCLVVVVVFVLKILTEERGLGGDNKGEEKKADEKGEESLRSQRDSALAWMTDTLTYYTPICQGKRDTPWERRGPFTSSLSFSPSLPTDFSFPRTHFCFPRMLIQAPTQSFTPNLFHLSLSFLFSTFLCSHRLL